MAYLGKSQVRRESKMVRPKARWRMPHKAASGTGLVADETNSLVREAELRGACGDDILR
jgi:hypothetical protein